MTGTRRKKAYFSGKEGPKPLSFTVEKRIRFSDADAMAIMWHGRYPKLFEMASEELTRRIGLTYKAYFENSLRAPIVQLHVDYHAPLKLDDAVRITARLIWCEAARLNTEFTIITGGGNIAATGYTVQMFTDAEGNPHLFTPPLIEKIRTKWRDGAFHELSSERLHN